MSESNPPAKPEAAAESALISACDHLDRFRQAGGEASETPSRKAMEESLC